jgi:hypothetical protein
MVVGWELWSGVVIEEIVGAISEALKVERDA